GRAQGPAARRRGRHRAACDRRRAAGTRGHRPGARSAPGERERPLAAGPGRRRCGRGAGGAGRPGRRGGTGGRGHRGPPVPGRRVPEPHRPPVGHRHRAAGGGGRVNTWWMTARRLAVFVRQPWFLFITLVQPVIWLFLFGSLFRRVVELPGFGAPSYLDYLVPGVVIMN